MHTCNGILHAHVCSCFLFALFRLGHRRTYNLDRYLPLKYRVNNDIDIIIKEDHQLKVSDLNPNFVVQMFVS